MGAQAESDAEGDRVTFRERCAIASLPIALDRMPTWDGAVAEAWRIADAMEAEFVKRLVDDGAVVGEVNHAFDLARGRP